MGVVWIMLIRDMSDFISQATGSDHDCGERCGACGSAHPEAGSVDVAGWRLAGLSAAVFLLPLCGAAIGAAWVGEPPGRQIPAAIAGAFVGVALARIAVRVAGRPRKNLGETSPCAH